MKRILLHILYQISKISPIYLLSKKIIDYHKNENNCELETNGELNFIINNKNKFEVVFDVGANVGEWTELISKHIPDAKVYSFEPSIITYKILSSKEYSKNVYLQNIGLGDKNESKDFYICENDSTLSSAFDRSISDSMKKEKVAFETLDTFCDKKNIKNISFLKIDTEGNELAVLQGAEKFIKEGKIDFIQFEYGGTYIDSNILLKDVFSFFEDKPYNIYKMKQKDLEKIDIYKTELENFQYSNYIAKRV